MSDGEATVIVRSKDASETERRKEAARQCLVTFGVLPAGRLLCYFDNVDWWAFKDERIGFGKANRGLSGLVTKSTNFQDWPIYVVMSIYPLCSEEPAFDFVTYLHDSSCNDPVGMAMTFTHELQHFVQYSTMPAVWKANERFKKRRMESDTGFDSHELPIEKEARIVAKRIAVRIHGLDAVNRYITKSIENAVDDLDRRNWSFIQNLDVSKPYDVELDTLSFDSELKNHPLPPKPLGTFL